MAGFDRLLSSTPDARDLQPGDVVFSQGEEGREAWVVLDGEVEIVVGDVVIATADKGSLVGEMALIDHEPRSATARAKTEARVAPIDQKRFLFLVQETPFFAIDVMRLMAARLRAMAEAAAS